MDASLFYWAKAKRKGGGKNSLLSERGCVIMRKTRENSCKRLPQERRFYNKTVR